MSILTLDEIERQLALTPAGHPSDAYMLHATARALAIMEGVPGDFATLVCRIDSRGLQVIEGADAVLAARIIRSRAALRGDRIWSDALGRRIRFRVVQRRDTKPTRTWPRRSPAQDPTT